MTKHNTHTRGDRPRSLYRMVLSLAVAALIAAAIPFAAIYVSTAPRPAALTALAPSSHRGSVKLITTASGRQIAVPAQNGSSPTAAPITTHTSGASGADN
ncbi:MAG: hypothetical protein KGL16_02195 [Acidobacteriota bacterium]|nr:hypothetical protein [Acidobacteriota bacterium]